MKSGSFLAYYLRQWNQLQVTEVGEIRIIDQSISLFVSTYDLIYVVIDVYGHKAPVSQQYQKQNVGE